MNHTEEPIPTIDVDPNQTTLMNLESTAMRWGLDVNFMPVGPYRGHTYLYGVTGRDAYDFIAGWERGDR